MQLSNKSELSIKVAKHLPFAFNEAMQTNSLRWTLLYKEEDGTFEDQTGIFKCKDYFNDFVAKYHGFEVAPYGLDTKKIKLNEEGCYVLLTGVQHHKEFEHNLHLLNKAAMQQGFPDLVFEGFEQGAMLFIPREYMKSTYTISFLTGLIRLAHADKCFNTLEEIVNYQQVDRPFKQYTDKALKQGLKSPVANWYYYAKGGENKITKENCMGYSQTIHNAGVYGHLNMLTLEGSL